MSEIIVCDVDGCEEPATMRDHMENCLCEQHAEQDIEEGSCDPEDLETISNCDCTSMHPCSIRKSH